VPSFVLASASPARLATLRSAGVEPVVIVSGVDESQLEGLPPAELALQLAELKCAAVAAREDLPVDALVLGCDSVLELDGQAARAGSPRRSRPRRSTSPT
jgi:septum formation protein